MNIYYFANSIYQFSHALPLYYKLKGTFVVRDKKKYYHLKRYLRFSAHHNEKTFLRTPKVIICHREDLKDLKGILIFFANAIQAEHEYQKAVTIFYEHGSSDKKYGGGTKSAQNKLRNYDYIFLWGEKNRMKIRELNVEIPEKKLIEIGGFKFDLYINKSISQVEQIKRLRIKDSTRKNVLYAPTWDFGKGTFKQYALKFVKEITKDFNLILRPHYHDRRYGKFVYILSKLKGIKNLYFSQPVDIIRNSILNDFLISDILISDVSSVVYEYLITGKPMILIDNKYDNKHRMPGKLNVSSYVALYDGSNDIRELIFKTLKSDYKKVYREMSKACFYSLDGTAVNKAVDFIKNLKKK